MEMPMPMTPPGPGGSNMDTNMNSSMDMMMHMSFYWGKQAIILFSGWPKDSLGMYILAALFVFVLAAAMEILSVPPTARLMGSNPVVVAMGEASVYAVRMALAYMVMLSVMSFNLGIFMAAVLGHAVGFFVVKVRVLAGAVSPQDSAPKV